jgi:HEPN domain-containing protein
MAESTDYLQWVAKAEGDWDGARLLMERFQPSVAHLITFGCQQAAEKYLKAVLVFHRVEFPRTHDLAQLVALGSHRAPGLTEVLALVGPLQPYAVNVRYPGFDPDRASCDDAVERAGRVRAVCRAQLNLAAS